MVAARWYPKAMVALLNAEVDIVADTIRGALVTNGYTWSEAHDYFDDITNEVVGTGYTADGVALAGKSVTYTPAASLSAWTANTAYVVGDVVRSVGSDGHVYKCIVAGTSHATTEPTWDQTPGQDTADGTVVWSEVGRGVVVFTSNNAEWASSTITARGMVIYKDTGTPGTSPLLGFVDFEQDESSNNGTFTVAPSALGWLRSFGGYGGT